MTTNAQWLSHLNALDMASSFLKGDLVSASLAHRAFSKPYDTEQEAISAWDNQTSTQVWVDAGRSEEEFSALRYWIDLTDN